MGLTCFKSNNNNNKTKQSKFSFKDEDLNNKDIILFKLKNLKGDLFEKLNILEEEIIMLKNHAKGYIKNNKKNEAKICITKKKLWVENSIKLKDEIIIIDKRIDNIKKSISDKSVKDILGESNKLLDKIKSQLDNEVYLYNKELLEENDILNQEAINYLNDDQHNKIIEQELNELND